MSDSKLEVIVEDAVEGVDNVAAAVLKAPGSAKKKVVVGVVIGAVVVGSVATAVILKRRTTAKQILEEEQADLQASQDADQYLEDEAKGQEYREARADAERAEAQKTQGAKVIRQAQKPSPSELVAEKTSANKNS